MWPMTCQGLSAWTYLHVVRLQAVDFGVGGVHGTTATRAGKMFIYVQNAARWQLRHGSNVIAYHVIDAQFELNGIIWRGEQYALGRRVALHLLGPGRFREYLGRWSKSDRDVR
jgi:uncharacterized membrane protein YgdD (TMEM256/DUF423 family)